MPPTTTHRGESSSTDPRSRDSGEHIAWEELRARLGAFVARRVADADDAEDIVQEVLLRVDRSIDGVGDDTPLTAWVYRVARNAVIDHYRSSARRRQEPVGALSNVPDRVEGADEMNSVTTEARREMERCLEPLLDMLDSKYREALRLTELEGMTQAQAADQVGVSVPGMKSRVQRARQRLATLYHEHCDITFDARRGPIVCEQRVSRRTTDG